jgi:DNA invertase Pin-like site-specific DNA recombinase
MSGLSFIAYCRVSSRKQPAGLELQRQRITAYVERVKGQILAWHEEMRQASPKASNVPKRQPELWRALDECRAAGATLIVARLDRLSRSTAFLSGLLESGPPLLIVDTPNASHFVLQIYAAAAEQYHATVSRRLRAAHDRARREGRKLNPHAKEAARRYEAKRRKQMRPLCMLIEDIRRSGPMSAGEVARILNERCVPTQRGRAWTNFTVSNFWLVYHRRWDLAKFRGHNPGPATEVRQALARAELLRPRIERYRSQGTTKEWQIAARLNADGVPTTTGVQWSQSLVSILLRRLDGRSGI